MTFRLVHAAFLPAPGRVVRHLDQATAHSRGPVVGLLTEDDRPGQKSRVAVAAARRRLGDFRPQEDALAWCGGDPASLLIVGANMADMGIRRVTYLRWERDFNRDSPTYGETRLVPTQLNLLPEV